MRCLVCGVEEEGRSIVNMVAQHSLDKIRKNRVQWQIYFMLK